MQNNNNETGRPGERFGKWTGLSANSKSLLPLIIGAAAALLLIVGGVLFFVFKPFGGGTPSEGEIRLCTGQEKWLVSKTSEKVDNLVWLENSSAKVSSAKLFDESGSEVAEFAPNEYDDMRYAAVVSVPLKEAKENKYYAVYSAEDSSDKKTNTITLTVVDSFPEGYNDSYANTSKEINEIIGSDGYKKLSDKEKADKLVKALEGYSGQDPEKGEAYAVKDSVKYNESLNTVSYVNALGMRCYINIEPRSELSYEGSGSLKYDFSGIDNISFNGEYKDSAEGSILMLIALSPDPAENRAQYDSLCNAIESRTSLDLTFDLADLENMRTKLSGSYDYIALGLHGGLYEFGNTVVPMIGTIDKIVGTTLDETTYDDYENGRVCFVTYQTESGMIVNEPMLTPLFFPYYYGEDGLKDKIIHLCSCHGFGDYPDNQNLYLCNSFLKSGAAAVSGHTQSVYVVYDKMLITEEIDNMLAGYSIGEALAIAENDYAANDVEFMEKNNYFNDPDIKQDVQTKSAKHEEAYNDVHGDAEASAFTLDKSSKRDTPPETKPTQTPTQKPTSAPTPAPSGNFKKVSGANQVIFADYSDSTFTLVDWSSGKEEVKFSTNNVYFGKDGVTKNPREGLSATPQGTFKLGFAFSTSPLSTGLDTMLIKPNMVWVDDPDSQYYNMLVTVNGFNGIPPASIPGMWNSSERTYTIFSQGNRSACILIEHNGDGFTKGAANKGSCMYISGKYSDLSKSWGDINISASDMTRLLSLLDESKNPYIVIS